MSDERQQPQHEHDSAGWIILGVVLVVVGSFLGARNLGLVPWPIDQVWNVLSKARFGVGVLLIGVFLIVWAQSGKGLPRPKPGTRLYRDREDKWLAGVLGGLARYFGIDPTPLRLAFIVLVVLLGAGTLVLAYLVMAVVVPLEPAGTPEPPQ